MERCDLQDPDGDLKLQLSKLVWVSCPETPYGLATKIDENISGDEAQPGEASDAQEPDWEGPPQFSSNRQQDAQEFTFTS